MTTRQYARLVSSWIARIGLDPHFFGTHSLRRTKATLTLLPSNRQLTCRAAAVRTHQDREHGQVSRH
jgi:hypothetical protein